MKTQWGRKESVIWPPHGAINTYGALFLSVAFAALLMYLHFTFSLTPLQQFYLPYYARTAMAGTIHKSDKYQLLYVVDEHMVGRLASEADVMKGVTPEAGNHHIPLTLSDAARQRGEKYIYRGVHTSFPNKPLHAWLSAEVFAGEPLLSIFELPLMCGLAAFGAQLPFAIARDVKRRKQLRYGRRLRGPERLTPEQWNKTVGGDGIGIKTDGLKEMIRIPARAEAQHIQIIGDTGSGKSTVIFQMLRQIRGRGDSAIVYDPALEFTARFYDERRGDIILNPLDARCPYWGPADELVDNSEADALAVSLFQNPDDKRHEFFTEIPQQIFAYLVAQYRPTPQELISWMCDPREIDRRVANTEIKNYIDRSAGPQRVGVLASLSKVAKSLRMLPTLESGNGRWSAKEWSKTRKGWIFITSRPPEREALRPLQSVWIDMLVLRLLNKPEPEQKRVWFVLDELASLQRLPQFNMALCENRKSNNPIIMGFQGKAQLEVIYGHLAEVMLSMPSTSIFLKTKEPKAGQWISEAIGKVEIERLKETHFDGTRAGRNFSLDRQIEPVVMESEISGLPDLHGFLKHGNYVTGFSFPYLDVPIAAKAFIPRVQPAKMPAPLPEKSPFADMERPLEPTQVQLHWGG